MSKKRTDVERKAWDRKVCQRKTLERWLRHEVGVDPFANATLLRHVFGHADPDVGATGLAAPGALIWRQFDDHEIFFDPRDDKIGMTLLAGRPWQRWVVDRAVAALRLAGRLDQKCTFLDVGANIGCTTLYAARTEAFTDTIAIEPESNNARILRRNIAANDLDDVVRVFELAATDTPGQQTLHVHSHNRGKHSLNADAAEPDARTVSVPGITIDGLLAANGVAVTGVGLVKIDVEGHEGAVLAGMPSLLRVGCPVVIEVTGTNVGTASNAWPAIRSHFGSLYRSVIDLESEAAEALADRVPAARTTAPPYDQNAEPVEPEALREALSFAQQDIQAFQPDRAHLELLIF